MYVIFSKNDMLIIPPISIVLCSIRILAAPFSCRQGHSVTQITLTLYIPP
jgi:hypothetical protein